MKYKIYPYIYIVGTISNRAKTTAKVSPPRRSKMAKAILSPIIQNIRGSIGNVTFYTENGELIIRKKIKKIKLTNSEQQKKMQNGIAKARIKWKQMLLKDRALWEVYAQLLNAGNKIIGMKRPHYHTKWTGAFAYCATNQLLTSVGFEQIEKPPLNCKDPPSPCTSIKQNGAYEGEIKFNIWLLENYKTEQEEIPTATQIWLKVLAGHGADIYLIQPAPKIYVQPVELNIDKLKVRKRTKNKSKTEVVKIKDLGHVIIKIQMRTVAKNGKFSLPTPAYTIEVI